MFKGLRPEDKKEVRRNLVSFMDSNPVKGGLFSNAFKWQIKLPKLKLNLRHMPIFLALLLLLGGGGTAAAAAQSSLPGDALYGVKNLTEEVRGWAAFSEDAKADWQITLAETRLDEVEKLYDSGKLSEEVKTKLEDNIKDKIDRVTKKAEEMKQKGDLDKAADVAARLENSLNTHQAILLKLEAKLEKKADNLEKKSDKAHEVAEKLKEKSEKVKEVKKEVEEELAKDDSLKMQNAAAGKLKAASNKIEEVKKFVEKKKSLLSAESLAKAQAKLTAAEQSVTDGKAKMNDKKYGEAFVLFQKAHWQAQEAKALAISNFEDKAGNNATSTPSGSATSTVKDKDDDKATSTNSHSKKGISATVKAEKQKNNNEEQEND